MLVGNRRPWRITLDWFSHLEGIADLRVKPWIGADIHACDRFVDDYFTADRAECAEHAKQCFARLVRCMLGATAIAERKLQHANPLPILGFDVGVGKAGVISQPEGEKKEQWKLQIKTALVRMRLDGGEASSLAGRLSFGAQHLFRRRVCACMCVRR